MDVERDERFTRGLVLFNKGEFFECHDEWEELWNELRGDERLCVQGFIQLAVGCLHALNGNMRGAVSQFEKSRAKFLIANPSLFGVVSQPVMNAVLELHASASATLADAAVPFRRELIPRLVPGG